MPGTMLRDVGILKEKPYTYPILKEVSYRKKNFFSIEFNYIRVESDKCHRRDNIKQYED